MQLLQGLYCGVTLEENKFMVFNFIDKKIIGNYKVISSITTSIKTIKNTILRLITTNYQNTFPSFVKRGC